MINLSLRSLSVFAVGMLGLTAASNAVLPSPIESFTVSKGVWYKQYSPAAPVLITKPYHFYSAVELNVEDVVTNVTLKLPSGQVRKLSDRGEFFHYQKFTATKPLQDGEFAVGRYGFTIDGTDGRKVPFLTLAADAYPSVPRIANWTDMQVVEGGLPATLNWSAFAGGSTNDFISVEISDSTDSRVVFNTPGLLEDGRLTGKDTQLIIPAGTLDPNTNYLARLLFVKKTGINTTAIPGAVGVAGYYRETEFPIKTQVAAPDEGRYEFAASAVSVNETNNLVNILVTRSGGTGSGSVVVSTANGTASSIDDYSARNITLQFDPGIEVSQISIPVFDDFRREGNETVLLALSSPADGAILGARSNAVLTIVDNEVAAAGIIQFKLARSSISETSAVAKLTVTRTGGSVGTVSARYTASGNTAAEGEDFTVVSGTVTFGPGQTNKLVAVPIQNDTIDESNETFEVHLSALTGGASRGSIDEQTVTILDNDIAGTVAFRSASFSVNENASNAVVQVSRTGGKASGVSVDYTTAAGTATGDDAVAVSGTIAFGAGETNKTFLVPILQDLLAEGNEAFTVHLSNVTGGGRLGILSNATVNLVDDESSISLSSAAYSRSESNSSVSIVLVRSGSLTTPVSVSLATIEGTALERSDFVGTNVVVNFPANTASKTILIPIVKDFVVEPNEDFIVSISNPQGGTQLGTTTSASVTLVNDDFPGTVAFSATSYTIAEGGVGSVIVRRTGGLAEGVTVQFATTTGTAVAGTDYTSVASTLTFAGGEASKTVKITTKIDVTPESTETVGLLLSNVTGGAVLGTVTTSLLKISNKPDPNAIPAAGPTFFKATITGIGHSLSKSLDVTHNPVAQETVTAGYVKRISAVQGLTGSKTTSTTSFPPQVTFQVLQMPFMVASGPTIVQVGGSSSSGGAVWTFTSFGGESHTYGTGDALASGTVTLDVVNPAAKILAGRFNFIAVQDDGNKKVRIQGSFRVNNVSVSN